MTTQWLHQTNELCARYNNVTVSYHSSNRTFGSLQNKTANSSKPFTSFLCYFDITVYKLHLIHCHLQAYIHGECNNVQKNLKRLLRIFTCSPDAPGSPSTPGAPATPGGPR